MVNRQSLTYDPHETRQPLAAPMFSLLLHRWLLRSQGKMDADLKHLNIMISGCRQLFLGDIDAGSSAFGPLHRYLTAHVVRLYAGGGGYDDDEHDDDEHDDDEHDDDEHDDDDIPTHHTSDDNHHQLLGVCAAFLPYYSDDDGAFLGAIERLAQSDRYPHRSIHGSIHFSAVDFAVARAVDSLSEDVRADAATVKYLRRLASLKAYVKDMRLPTRIRLQGVVYSLTQPGGPRYASKAVNRTAIRALDELFPHGKRARRAINFGFRGLFVFSRLTSGMYYACVVVVVDDVVDDVEDADVDHSSR